MLVSQLSLICFITSADCLEYPNHLGILHFVLWIQNFLLLLLNQLVEEHSLFCQLPRFSTVLLCFCFFWNQHLSTLDYSSRSMGEKWNLTALLWVAIKALYWILLFRLIMKTLSPQAVKIVRLSYGTFQMAGLHRTYKFVFAKKKITRFVIVRFSPIIFQQDNDRAISCPVISSATSRPCTLASICREYPSHGW